MKQRIITAGVALIILACVLFWLDTVIFNVAIAVIAVLATNELLLATKYVENKVLSCVSLLFVALVPFFHTATLTPVRNILIYGFIIVLFVILLIRHRTLRIEQVGLVFMVSTLIPYALSTLVYMRNDHEDHALFYILLTLAGAWVGDSGAYFIGSLLGKHPLAPGISPKKTVEGLIGGLASTVLSFLLLGYLYSLYCGSLGLSVTIVYGWLPVLAVVCGLLGVLGDLSASIIKRQCAIKDFGNIMPGHGGILDRFDSVLFVAPFMFIALQVVHIIQ